MIAIAKSTQPMKYRRIIYTSHATKHFNKRNLLDLLHDSRAFNEMDGISGVLIHKEGLFLQVIEGESLFLDDLLERLKRDPRHDDVTIIDDQPTDTKLFPKWSMGCADFDDPSLSLIPGIRTDISNPKVIDDLIKRLPEIAMLLAENIE